MSTPTTHDEKAFDKRFLAILSLVSLAAVMIYVVAVTFIPLPDSGVKYADIAVPLLLGSVIAGITGYWFGASKAGEKDRGHVPGAPTEPESKE